MNIIYTHARGMRERKKIHYPRFGKKEEKDPEGDGNSRRHKLPSYHRRRRRQGKARKSESCESYIQALTACSVYARTHNFHFLSYPLTLDRRQLSHVIIDLISGFFVVGQSQIKRLLVDQLLPTSI